MKTYQSFIRILASAGILLAAVQPSYAGSDANAMPGGKVHTYPTISDAAYDKFGGKAGVSVWVDDLFKYILADNRINQIFITHGKVERQMALNKELEAMVLGGPSHYTGASMSAAHEEMGLTLTQFNAVVEDAYLACDDARTPYSVCNQLIAALAPFERVIVTK